MYLYTDFDRRLLRERAAQFRDQLARWQAGTLDDEAFRPLRLQNGWYVQRHAPMLRVAVPYGAISAAQLRALAHIARHFDRPDPATLAQAQAAQDRLGPGSELRASCAHFTTRQNVQFNWIDLAHAADVMDTLAAVDLHGIQTSGNCVRNITTDALAGIAADEIADPRPWCELIRQWSTLHPEFAHLPRKFKIAVSGAREDRAASLWHDVGLQLLRHDEAGDAPFDGLGFRVAVGGGMGRTPMIAPVLRTFLPAAHILNYLEAVLRVYNRWGRRDNLYKARIKTLVRAEGERFSAEVEDEFARILRLDGPLHTVTEADLRALQARFAPAPAPEASAGPRAAAPAPLQPDEARAYARWGERNVHAHRLAGYRAVTLSFKRPGLSPGDATAEQLDAAADLAARFSAGEARVTHTQNLLLPWVREADLIALWTQARALGLATPHVGLLTDLIACPGGDYCSLANARTQPLAQALLARYQDLDELHDLGAIDLHVSGCINSCGHHHSGHIGVLGVDKDGQEWFQITLGGSDGSAHAGPATPGKVLGPAFAADEVPDAIEAVLEVYRQHRLPREPFIDTVRRMGLAPFKAAADAVRPSTQAVGA
ncbi:nitrite/sulfite reductase [Tibeticola sp.]|uniref:nitrite/sulfite reductase n=1 Tax=Tibeticola sp. TaxID=2005368 RepID=UPI0025CF0EAD|nr:nitrite/sulfite reductase [Tibeticola sp.]